MNIDNSSSNNGDIFTFWLPGIFDRGFVFSGIKFYFQSVKLHVKLSTLVKLNLSNCSETLQLKRSLPWLTELLSQWQLWTTDTWTTARWITATWIIVLWTIPTWITAIWTTALWTIMVWTILHTYTWRTCTTATEVMATTWLQTPPHMTMALMALGHMTIVHMQM